VESLPNKIQASMMILGVLTDKFTGFKYLQNNSFWQLKYKIRCFPDQLMRELSKTAKKIIGFDFFIV
jgi:hypothetical protein